MDRMRSESRVGPDVTKLCSQCEQLDLECSSGAPGRFEAGEQCGLITVKVISKR